MEDWAGNNATKVLRHVCGIKKDQRSCPAMIPTNYHHAYMSLLHSKMEAKTDRAMRQEILDMNLATTDSMTIGHLSARKRPPEGGYVDMTSASPMTASTSVQTSAMSSAARKMPRISRGSFQQTLTGSRRTTKEQKEKADVAMAHWVLANSKPHNEGDDPLFKRMVREMQQCGSDYKPPTRNDIGGRLLEATYKSYMNEEQEKFMQDVHVYGATIFGDGATITGVPMINVLASSPGNPSFVLDVIDCSEHMIEGGKKDAKYIAYQMLSIMNKVDPKKTLFTQVSFDGAGNVQKAGNIMVKHYDRAIVTHGAEHVVALVVEKFIRQDIFRHFSIFCKVVSN
jgi:hypothetical protein